MATAGGGMMRLHPLLQAVACAGGLTAAMTSACAQTAPAPKGGGIYTCVDQTGRRLTSDRPIPECVDREQQELGSTGTVRRVIGPTLTDRERAALDAQHRKEAEERTRLADQRRREKALIARYPDKLAHDAERANAISGIDDVVQIANVRISDLQKQRKALDTELEFYRNDPIKAPAKLRRQLSENEDALLEQMRFIEGKEREKRRIHQRFDQELAQLMQLWVPQQSSQSAPPRPVLQQR